MMRRLSRDDPCRRVLRQLQPYLDGEAGPDAGWWVARHLARCEECFSHDETIRAVQVAVRRLRRASDAAVLRRLRAALLEPGGPDLSR
jgi:anti-sigma factor RsiW